MTTMNYEQRQKMIGRRYSTGQNSPRENEVTICDVRLSANGFTVAYVEHGGLGPFYLGLRKFMKRYPHEVGG